MRASIGSLLIATALAMASCSGEQSSNSGVGVPMRRRP